MADSYRLTVLKRLTTLLEGMTLTEYGYTDATLEGPALMTGCVIRGRMVFGDNDPKTMISILEAPRSDGFIFSLDGTRLDRWPLLIQGWRPDDKTHATDPLYSMVDDVERRLSRITAVSPNTGYPKYSTDYLLGAGMDGTGQLIASFEMGAPIVRPATNAQGVSSRSFMYLPIQVGLARIAVD